MCNINVEVSKLKSCLLERNPGFILPEDEFFEAFLYAKRFDIKKSCVTIENFFKYVKPVLIPTLSYTQLSTLFEQDYTSLLISKHTNKLPIYVIRFGGWDTDTYNFEQIIALLSAQLFEIASRVEAPGKGVVIIADLSNIKWSHMKKIIYTLWKFRSGVSIFHSSVPFSIKQMHVINNPDFCKPIFGLIRLLFQDKMLKRLYLHGHDKKSFNKFIGRELLPVDLGGLVPNDKAFDKSISTITVAKHKFFDESVKCGYPPTSNRKFFNF